MYALSAFRHVLSRACSALPWTWLLAPTLLWAQPSPGPQGPQFPQAPTPPLPTDPATTTASTSGGELFTQAFFLKMGFSFMVGLAMGYALKIAFKIALVVFGIILIALFALQYYGIIQVNWSGLETHYNGWTDWLSAHASAFFDFVVANLSSAVSFFAGLALGLKL